MGRKVSDGKAWNVTIPAESYDVLDGELVRVSGVNGCTVGEVLQTDTDRTLAIECAHDFIHSIHLPSAVNPAAGDFLYWATPSAFQYGPTHLQATKNGAPAFFVMESRTSDGAGGYVVRGRVLNGVLGS